MSEWKRIFLNRIWLGTAALSLLFSLVIYATAQSSRVGSSVLAYREHTNQWTQILSVVSPEDGLALLERENQTLQGWNTARMLVQLEEWQGQIDEEILNRYREQYENLDEMLHAVRSETAPELDIAAQESVARWIDRLVYQMGYAEFVQSVSTQAAAIRRSPMFSDSNTFVYRNADRTEADYQQQYGLGLLLQQQAGQLLRLVGDQLPTEFEPASGISLEEVYLYYCSSDSII